MFNYIFKKIASSHRFKQFLKFNNQKIVQYPNDVHKTIIDLLDLYRVNVIMDVGANEGQFGGYMRSIGYTGRIISFEPLSTAFRLLEQKTIRDKRWTGFQMGLGDFDGPAVINVSGTSQSSSLLNMGETHLRTAPE